MILKDVDINKIQIERTTEMIKLSMNGIVLMALNDKHINYSRWVLYFFNNGLSLRDAEKLFEMIVKTPYKEVLDHINDLKQALKNIGNEKPFL